MVQVRRMKDHEHYFFLEMLYESIHIPENKPPLEELLNRKELIKYSRDWGRFGDEVLVAVDEKNDLVGAIWCRLFPKEEQGYGFVDEDTPEIGMAICESSRGKGIGLLLLREMINLAKKQGVSTLSLSVDPDNKPAMALYQKVGFQKVGGSGTSITMLCFVHESEDVIHHAVQKPKTLPKEKPASTVTMIIGAIISLSGVMLFGMTLIAAAIYSNTLFEWYTGIGIYGTAILHVGVIPIIISIILVYIGSKMIQNDVKQ